jgi:cytochrome P450
MPDLSSWPFPVDDPYPAYRKALMQAPVQWNERLGAHLVLSHNHAVEVLRSPKWSSDPRNSPELLAALGGPDAGLGMAGRSLLSSDPPAHTRLRRSVNRFFTPRAVAQIQDRVAAIVDSAFERLLDGEPLELMSDFAYAIPLAIIAELFDVGLEGAQLLRSETPKLAKILELDPTPADIREGDSAAMAVMLFLVPLVADRRRDPGTDLLSALIHGSDDGESLGVEEVVTMSLLLLAAGHETTASLIGNGTLALLENSAQLDLLARHPELSMQAVDELLRYDSPVQLAGRIAHEDLVLGDVAVKRGDQAFVVLGSANRDPAHHANPDRLDFTRAKPAHLAFGNGPHFCVGAGLARLEAREVFTRLAQADMPSMAGDWSFCRDSSRTFRRLRSLHMRIDRSAIAVDHTLTVQES